MYGRTRCLVCAVIALALAAMFVPAVAAAQDSAPAPATAVAPPPPAASDYKHKPISLDVQDAEIGTVLRSLAGFSGTNIVASPRVEGKVTVKLEDVPWIEALGVILKAHSFDYVEENGIYRIDTAADLREEKLAVERARKQVEDLAALQLARGAPALRQRRRGQEGAGEDADRARRHRHRRAHQQPADQRPARAGRHDRGDGREAGQRDPAGGDQRPPGRPGLPGLPRTGLQLVGRQLHEPRQQRGRRHVHRQPGPEPGRRPEGGHGAGLGRADAEGRGPGERQQGAPDLQPDHHHHGQPRGEHPGGPEDPPDRRPTRRATPSRS